MALKILFLNVVRDTVDSVKRFMPTYYFALILFLASAFSIITSPNLSHDSESVVLRIILMSLVGILVCTLGRLICERFEELLSQDILLNINFALVLMSGLSYFLIKDILDNTYVLMEYSGILIALFAGILYLAIDKDQASQTFAHLLSKSIFNGVVCGIMALGILICILAFNTLIYAFADLGKIIAVFMLFIGTILFVSLTLSIIPHRGAGLKTPMIFKSIVFYVAFPLFMVLLAVLYIYLGKILVTMSFPSGQINWVASFASLFFVFFIFSLEQYTKGNKITRLFVKFGGALMIPIIIVQFMGIAIRLSHYGLTTTRYLSVTLNILALAFAGVTLIKNCRFIKHMLLLGAGVALLLTLTPLNVLDVPMRDQTSRLMTLLDRNNMLENSKIVPNVDVPQADRIAITSAYQYLVASDAKKPDIIQNNPMAGYSFTASFGFVPAYEGYDDTRYLYDKDQFEGYVDYSQSYPNFLIAGYAMFYSVSNGDWSQYKDGILILDPIGYGNEIRFDLKSALETLFQEYGRSKTEIPMEFTVGEDKLMLTEVYFQVDSNNQVVDVMNYSGYFLKKE